MGDIPPLSQRGIIVIAEEGDGEIVGFATCQYVLHIEPVWVAPSHRGKWLLQNMLKLVFQGIPKTAQAVFCYTEDDRVGKLITHLGMQPLPTWKVFRWMRG